MWWENGRCAPPFVPIAAPSLCCAVVPLRPVCRYEIATTEAFRIAFETGLECTTANYSTNADGTIKVYNSGSKNAPNGARSAAIGTAKQVSGGKLEVTFAPAFLNIYSPYWIVGLYGEGEYRCVGRKAVTCS